MRKFGSDAHIYIPGAGLVTGANFVDSAGTTTASVDNPVGLSLDALQAMTLGSELVTNGTNLVTTTGWAATALSGAPASLSVSGGSLVVTNTGVTYGAAAQTVPVTSGLTYQVTALLTKVTAAAVNIRVGSTAFGYEYTDQAATGIAVPITATFRATSSNVFISLLNQDYAHGAGIYGKISVREIPGIHATQATTANKPILRRGLLNLLTQSQTYSHADWAKYATGTASAPTLGALQLAPDGTTTAQRVTFSCPGALVSDQSMLDHASMPVVSGQPHTQIAYIKGIPGQTISFRNVAGSGYGNLTFDGTWQLLTKAETSISTTGSWSIGLRGTTGSTTGTVVADLWTAGLFQGTYTAQQILDAGGIPLTKTAAASNPSAGKYYWQFDSTDVLTATYPAGYESATIIDALKSGVVTNQGVNVVGAYSIGPSVNTAGRILLRTAPTAAQLLTLQRFAETWI